MSWQRGHSDRFGDNRGPSDRYGGGGNRGYSNRGHGDNRGYGNPRIRPEAAGTHQYSDDYAEEISIFGGYAEGADDGGWHTPPRNFAYPLRPAPQQRRPTGPAPERPIRGDGRGGGAYRGAPRVPYVPGNSDRIGGLPRNPRPRYDYDPSAQGPPEPETYTQPRAGQQPLRPTPQYFPADQGDPTFRPSVQSDRSIYIGFDPSAESRGNTPSSATQNAPVQGYNQQRRPVANVPPPPSSRRVAPSYYPQQTMQVSPIPEESSLSRHDSYASSAAIPTTWGPDEFYSSSSGHSDNRHPIEGEGEHGPGLVRQASVGRKTRPLLTEIKSIDRSKSRRGSASAEADLSPNTSPVVSRMASPVLQIPQTTTSPGSNPGLSPTRDHSLGPPRSPRSPNIPSPLSRPPTSTDDHPFSEKPPFYRNQSDNKQPSATAKELGILVGEDDVLGSNQRTSTFGGTQRASTMGDGQRASTSSRIPGRRLPPRLNIDAVRDAEARGSLTSLPDLIRRATKLAAVLETGRPGSSMAWGRRNSMLGPGGMITP